MKKLFYFLICLLGLFSCSEGAPENEGSSSGGSGSGGSSQPQVTLDVTSSDFTVDGGSKLITFTASEAWTASVVNGRASSWCKVEPTSGAAGNASVTITTTANDTPDDRTASVVIKAGNVSKTISVSQKQKDALTLTSSKFELSSQGGEVLIEVKANVDYECEIEESSQSWITYTGSRALKSSTVVLKVSENAQLEGRSGKVYIKGNGLSETVEIYQAGETPAIVISQKEYTVSSAGATITVDVSSNVDVEVELPSGVDWISENATRSTSTHTYRFDVAPSEEYNQRTAEIKFINKENNLAEAVTVTQVQKDALVLAKDNYTVSNGGGQIEVEVGHNIDFDVSIGVDWISQVTSRSLNTSNLVFNVSANTAYDSRSGVITFASKDGIISQTVTVYQAAEGALIISQKDVVVGQESGSLSFEIQSNLEFTVSEPDADWLRPVTSRGLTTHTLRYEYDANTSYASRVAKIIVTNTQNNQCDTLTVTQAQKDALVLAKESYTVENSGGQLSVEIGHNVDFDVSIDVDWITQPVSRSFVTSALVFNVEPNTNYDSRSGVITFTSKDGSITQSITVYQAAEDALIVSQKEIALGSSSGTFSFEVQTNVEFSVSSPDVDWLRPVTDASGRGLSTHTLRYEYDANTTYDSRQAQIVVTDTQNNRSETITITQVQKDAIVLGKDSYTVGNTGGQIQVEVGHNVDFDVTIDVDWITQPVSRSFVTSSLTFNVAANPVYDTRSGVITFTSKDGSISQSITVYQAAEDALIVSQKEIALGSSGGTFSFEVQTNVEFSVSTPDVDWLRPVTDASGRGLSTHTLRFEYDANTTYDSRQAQIVITDTQNNRSETITITQVQKDAIVLGKDSYTIGNTGGQIQVEVGHNVDFDVTIDVDWITQPVSRSFVTSSLTFNVAANPSYDTRSGVITFMSKDSSISQSITVYQAAEDALIVSQKEIALGLSSGTFLFEVQTNVEFSVSNPDVDWLRPVTDALGRGLSTHTLRYEYDANTTYDSRQAQIVVTDTQNNRSETITVTQAQNNAIVLGKNVYQVDGKGGQLQIEVSHNVDFDIQINESWISQSASRSLSSSTLILNVEANPDDYTRWGYVYLTAKDGSCSQTIVIEQTEEDKFIISNKEIFVSSWSGSTWIEIQANVPFSVGNPDVSWLRVPNNSRSMSYHLMLVEFDENTSYESRVGKIVVTDLKNNKSDTITVTQAQKDAIVLAETNYKLSSKSGQLQIKVDHNVEFDVSIDVDWITQSISRSLGSSTLIFNVAENPNQKDREGTITFTSKNGAVTQKVKVLQKSSSFDPSINDWEDDGEHGGTAE